MLVAGRIQSIQTIGAKISKNQIQKILTIKNNIAAPKTNAVITRPTSVRIKPTEAAVALEVNCVNPCKAVVGGRGL